MNRLVILDLDGVIIKGQSQQIFLNYLFRKGTMGVFFYLKIFFWFTSYKLGLADNPEKIMRFAYSFSKNKPTKEIENIMGVFFSEELRKFIFPEIIDIINKHKQKGEKLIILSNTVDIIAKKVADFLGVKDYISTRLEILEGKFTGKILGNIVYGENKLDSMNNFIKKNHLSLDDSFAYADHISDLPLLLMVKNPYAVNPDRFLLTEAERRNWPILKFQGI